jgi:hypothetical protein
MTGDVVNLNKARKAKAHKASSAEARQNRIRFGRTKAEKLAAAQDAERTGRQHRGRKRDRDPSLPPE